MSRLPDLDAIWSRLLFDPPGPACWDAPTMVREMERRILWEQFWRGTVAGMVVGIYGGAAVIMTVPGLAP